MDVACGRGDVEKLLPWPKDLTHGKSAPSAIQDIPWACEECGSSEGFTTVHYEAGDADARCDECGSLRTDESCNVLRTLANRVDTLQAERAAADSKDEPVAWQDVHDRTNLYYRKPVQGDVRPLYAAQSAPPEERDNLEVGVTIFDADVGMKVRWLEKVAIGTKLYVSSPPNDGLIVPGHMLANAAENLLEWLGKTIRAEEVEIKTTDIGAEGTTKRMNTLTGAIKAMRAKLAEAE